MRSYTSWTVCLLLTLSLFIPTAVRPQAAHALCALPNADLMGNWTNVDPNTRGLVRAEVSFECGDVVLCDESGNCQQDRTGYLIRLFGSCHPTACDWGWADAAYVASGDYISASYNHGFATRSVTARVIRSGPRAGQLRVFWRTHFTDGSGRSDYSRVEYFRK